MLAEPNPAFSNKMRGAKAIPHLLWCLKKLKGKIMDTYQNSRVVDDNDGTVYRVKLIYSGFHKLTKDKLTQVFKGKKAEIDLNWQKDHDAQMQSNNNKK